MTKIIELLPDKNLINPDFEKYQFTADIVPITSVITLENEIYRQELSVNQESWLEARLFAFHNHLFKNPYDSSCWFIDKEWVVWRLNKDNSLDRIHSLKTHNENVTCPLYNPSIGFTNNKIMAITNGGEKLIILVENACKELKDFTLNNIEPGIILDVQYVQRTSMIIITICSIVEDSDKKCTQLTLLSYFWKDVGSVAQCFEFINKQILKIRGTLEYAYVEESGKYLHSICQDTIIFDGHNSVSPNHSNIKSTIEPQIKIPKYCWSQDEDSLTVWVKIPEKYQGKKAKVHVVPTKLSITIDDITLIQGECQHRLSEGLTTWKYEKDTLQLDLFKFETGLMWSELIKGDTGGECLPNEALASEIHSRLAHLCTEQQDDRSAGGQPCMGFNAEQLEECDIEGKDNLLQRFDITTRENTHLAMLSTNNHVLFTYKTKRGQVICLRHDHDGCVWETETTNDQQWEIQHIHTFPGFGYVEASKSKKKFCVSPPDGSYVAIVEHTRHVFIYGKPERDARVGKQWIVDLDCEAFSIMGAVATNRYLTILTKNKLYRLQIYQ